MFIVFGDVFAEQNDVFANGSANEYSTDAISIDAHPITHYNTCHGPNYLQLFQPTSPSPTQLNTFKPSTSDSEAALELHMP